MDTVSFVFQNSRLIKGTIFDNVRLGKPDATREEVMNAIVNAQCKDIIDKLPNGIDTVIGSKGTYLSGGEQQRIAIARVMLKDSPIIIMDEATAFADPDNEYRIQKALTNMSKGKTVIMMPTGCQLLSTLTGYTSLKTERYQKAAPVRNLWLKTAFSAKCGTTIRPPYSGRSQRRRKL